MNRSIGFLTQPDSLTAGGVDPFHGLVGPVLALLLRKGLGGSVTVWACGFIAGQQAGDHNQKRGRVQGSDFRGTGILPANR